MEPREMTPEESEAARKKWDDKVEEEASWKSSTQKKQASGTSGVIVERRKS